MIFSGGVGEGDNLWRKQKNLVGGLLGVDIFQIGGDNQNLETYFSETYSGEPKKIYLMADRLEQVS